eukprot:6891554-Alexandrium_andersonii.AAC.1
MQPKSAAGGCLRPRARTGLRSSGWRVTSSGAQEQCTIPPGRMPGRRSGRMRAPTSPGASPLDGPLVEGYACAACVR